MIFAATNTESLKKRYGVAIETLRCYASSTNYTLKIVNVDTDPRVNRHCKNDLVHFKKHCAAGVYLEDTDWMLVLDADTGVVNPNHCVEEWIDDRVDLVFYERFFNWEVASGNYLARNTPFARKFILDLADREFEQNNYHWPGYDNGMLMLHILKTALPAAEEEIQACDDLHHKAYDYESYMAHVTCVKLALGAVRLFPPRLRILRRGHAWVRDFLLTDDGWSDYDFMFHGWKANEVMRPEWISPFTKPINSSECGNGYAGWHLRKADHLTVSEVRNMLASEEKKEADEFPQRARIIPFLDAPDVAACYPHCDDAV